MAKQPAKTLTLTPDELGLLRRYIATANAILERYAENAETIAGLPTRLMLLEMAVREGSTEEADAIKALGAKIKRLEELELLRQVGKDQSLEARRARGDIKDEHTLEHLQDMLIEITKRLQFTELKRARVGLNADYVLIAEIEELEAARLEIEAQINELRKQTGKLE